LSICLLATPWLRAQPSDAPQKATVVQDNISVDDKAEADIKGALKYLAGKQAPTAPGPPAPPTLPWP